MNDVNTETLEQRMDRVQMATKEKSMKLDNFRLLVNDFSASFQFWHDIIGLTLIYRDNAGIYAYLEAGNVRIELLKADYFASSLGQAKPAPMQEGYHAVIVFRTEDVDALYADLIKRGAPSLASPMDHPEWFCRTAHLLAPDRYVLELFKPLADMPTTS